MRYIAILLIVTSCAAFDPSYNLKPLLDRHLDNALVELGTPTGTFTLSNGVTVYEWVSYHGLGNVKCSKKLFVNSDNIVTRYEWKGASCRP